MTRHCTRAVPQCMGMAGRGICTCPEVPRGDRDPERSRTISLGGSTVRLIHLGRQLAPEDVALLRRWLDLIIAEMSAPDPSPAPEGT